MTTPLAGTQQYYDDLQHDFDDMPEEMRDSIQSII